MDTQNNNGPVNNQPVQGQPVYQSQPVYQNPQQMPTSVGGWFLTILLMCIPIVGLVLLFVWAFGNNTETSKQNWARAQLIWMIICAVFSAIFGATFLALVASLASSSGLNL